MSAFFQIIEGIFRDRTPRTITGFQGGVNLTGEISKINPAKLLTAGPGVKIPVVYGKNRIGGHIIESNLEGLPIVGQQRFRLLVALGWGPFVSIGQHFEPTPPNGFDDLGTNVDTLEIDNNPADNFVDLNVSLRYGHLDQPEFKRGQANLGTIPVSIPLLPQGIIGSFTTTNAVDFIEFNIDFQGGLFNNSISGRLPVKSTFQYRYKPTSGGSFSSWISFDIEGLAADDFIANFRSILLVRDQYDFEIRNIGTTPATLESGSAHNPVLTSVSEFGGNPRAYPRIALLELSGLVTQEINSSSAKSITVEVSGRQVRRVIGGVLETNRSLLESDNPAWCALDLILDPIIGLGDFFNTSNVDLDSFEVWGDRNNEIINSKKRHTFNHVFQGNETAWEAFVKICKMSEAYPMFSNGKLSVGLDITRSSIALVGQGVIKDGSLRLNFRTRTEKYDAVSFEYIDELIEFEPNTERARNSEPFVPASYREQKIERIGITNREQAARVAGLELRRVNLIHRSITFEMSLDGFSLLPGDVFDFSHDTPGYGISGRIIEDAVNSGLPPETRLKLDRDITVVGGESITIQNIEGDEMDTRSVISAPGNYSAGDIVKIDGPLSFIPRKASQYAFGSPPTKPFEVRSIALTPDFTLKVQAREYNPAIYSDTIEDQNTTFSRLPKSGKTALDPTNLKAENVTRVRQDGFTFTTLEVNWQYPAFDLNSGIPAPVRAEIYFRVLGFQFWQQVGTVGFPGSTFTVLSDLNPGTTYEFAVVPVTIRGNKKHPNNVPRVSAIYTGPSARPEGPSNASISEPSQGTLQLDWTRAVDETFTQDYEIRYGFGWQGAQLVGRVLDDTIQFQAYGLDPSVHAGLGGLPTPARFYIRARNFAGSYSHHTEVVELEPTLNGSIIVEEAARALTWPSTGAGEVDGLVLVSGSDFSLKHSGSLLEGSYRSKIFNSGNTNPKDARLNVRVRGREPGLTWSTSTGIIWQDSTGEARAWDGVIDDDEVATLLLMRASNDFNDLNNDIAAWEPLSNFLGVSFQYFQYMVLLMRQNTDLEPYLEEAFFTIEQ